jgi:hypothetical protein
MNEYIYNPVLIDLLSSISTQLSPKRRSRPFRYSTFYANNYRWYIKNERLVDVIVFRRTSQSTDA